VLPVSVEPACTETEVPTVELFVGEQIVTEGETVLRALWTVVVVVVPTLIPRCAETPVVPYWWSASRNPDLANRLSSRQLSR
jgi:hypothetical protein